MGCHQHHTTDTIYDSYVPSIERIYLMDSLNDEMIKYEIVLQELEEVRFNYSKALGNMLYNSGAIVAKKANLSHSLIALLYITSRDLTSDVFSYLIISKNKPIVMFLDGCSPSASMIQTKNDINNYVEECERTLISMMTIGNHVSYINKSFENNLPRWKEEYSILVKNDPKEKTIFDQKFFRLGEKLKRAYLLSNEIISKSSNYQNEIDYVIGNLQNEREKERYFTIFRKIHNDHLKYKNDDDNRSLYLNNMTPHDTFNNQWKTLYNNHIVNNRLRVSYEMPKNETLIGPNVFDTNIKPSQSLEIKKIVSFEHIYPLTQENIQSQLRKNSVEEEIILQNDKVIQPATEPLQGTIPVIPIQASKSVIPLVDETSNLPIKFPIPISNENAEQGLNLETTKPFDIMIKDKNILPTTSPMQVNNLDGKNIGQIINEPNIQSLQETIPIKNLQHTVPIVPYVEDSKNFIPNIPKTAELEKVYIPVIPLKDSKLISPLNETSNINTLPISENLKGTIPVIPLQPSKHNIPFSNETSNLPLKTPIPISLDGVDQGLNMQTTKPVDIKIEGSKDVPSFVSPLQGTIPVILKPVKESVIPTEATNIIPQPNVKTPTQGAIPVILLPNNDLLNPVNDERTNIPLQPPKNMVPQGTIPVILLDNKEPKSSLDNNLANIPPQPEKLNTLQETVPVVRLQGTKPVCSAANGTWNLPLFEPSSTDEFSLSKQFDKKQIQNTVNYNQMKNNTMQQLQTTLPITKTIDKSPREEDVKTSKFITDDKIKKIEELTKLKQSLEEETNLYKKKSEKSPVFYVNQFSPIRSWNISLINSMMVPDNDSYVKCICMNYETNHVYFGTKSGKIHTLDLKTFEFFSSIQAHDLSVRSLYYINDGCSIISGGVDGKLIKWSITQGRREEFIRSPSAGSIRSITSMMNGEKIYVASGTYIECYNLLNMREETNSALSMNSIVNCVMWNKEHQLLVAGLKNGEVIFVKPQIKSVIAQFRDHQLKINSLAYCSYLGHHSVATCSKDNIIRIYNLDDRVLTYTVESYSKKIYFPKHIIYGYDEKSLFTAHEDGKIFVVDYTKREKKKYYFVKKSSISACFYCGDGNTIITGNKNSQIDIFTAN